MAAARAFGGTVIRPYSTFIELEQDQHAALHGALVLVFVSLVYILILVAYVASGYPAASESALGLAPLEQYRWQIWYQAPLFFATTALISAVLLVISRGRSRSGFGVVFGRLCLATAAPFAVTTMLVESAVALLLVLGTISPKPTLAWLTGAGAPFAASYQVIGVIWLTALVTVAVKATADLSWWLAGVTGLFLVVLYAVPIALLIR